MHTKSKMCGCESHRNHVIYGIDFSDLLFFQRAVKITLSFLKNIRKIQHLGLKTNILLRFDKLEKFAFNYARFPRRFRAKIINSTEEISIQDEELGKVSTLSRLFIDLVNGILTYCHVMKTDLFLLMMHVRPKTNHKCCTLETNLS